MIDAVGLLGYGYTAQAFAKLLSDNIILGTKRDLSQIKSVDNNINLLEFNSQNILNILHKCNSLLISIPPNHDGNDPILKDFKQALIDRRSHINWIGYLSSTGVYGNHDGNWVDETSMSRQIDSRSSKRLQSEHQWLSLYKQDNLPIHIFRLAGIYGPGRSVIDKLKSGKDYCVYKKGQYFSRVHVDDIAAILLRSLKNPSPGETYNVCDDHPAPSHEVDNYATKLLKLGNLKCVDHEDADLSPMAKSFYAANRRVSNAKVKNKLSYQMQYPSYEEGLLQIFNSL